MCSSAARRAPSGLFQDSLRTFSVIDQKLPVPFSIGNAANLGAGWIPGNDTLSEDFGGVRQFSRFRAYHDAGFTPAETTSDTRLIVSFRLEYALDAHHPGRQFPRGPERRD